MEVNDSFKDLIKKFSNIDKAEDKGFNHRWFNYHLLDLLYAENWLAGRVIDAPAKDMCREWRTISGNLPDGKHKTYVDYEKKLKVKPRFQEALTWSRLYGGCLIVMGLKESDTGKPEEPLDLRRIKKGSLQFLHVVDRNRVAGNGQIDADPASPNFGKPEVYRITEVGINVHNSRTLRFDGIKLPYFAGKTNDYWGASVLRRVFDTILRSDTGAAAMANMMQENNADIISMKDFFKKASDKDALTAIVTRVKAMKQIKGFDNVVLLDKEEEYETKEQHFNGVPDVMDRLLMMVSAASGIPVTRLLGKSAEGLNATGEGDLKNYYDEIASEQSAIMGEQIERLDTIMQLSLFGSEVNGFSYEWNPLFQLSEKEQSEVDLNNAQRDQIYLTNNVLTEDIIAENLQHDDTYSNIPDDYINQLKEGILGTRDPFSANLPGAPGNGTTGEAANMEEIEEGTKNKEQEKENMREKVKNEPEFIKELYEPANAESSTTGITSVPGSTNVFPMNRKA